MVLENACMHVQISVPAPKKKTHFLPIASTPYIADVITTAPPPMNVDASRQNMMGRKPNL